MVIKDILLSLDMGPTDCLYRIRREEGSSQRVVYVVITDLDIIPEDSRTYGPDLLRELARLKGWYDTWDTLTVYKNESGIQGRPDEFKPHALSKEQILGDYEFFNLLELPVLQSPKTRVFRVTVQDRECFLKIARFEFELGWLAQEIRTYHMLMQQQSTLTPRLLGYAFEERSYRVIGFILEEIVGRPAEITDLKMCERALEGLHSLDIIHGDLNRHNIFITDNGIKFIDLEDSCVRPPGKLEDWDAIKAGEMQSLAEKLSDNSGKGCPWTLEES
jgi:hypothetical protein